VTDHGRTGDPGVGDSPSGSGDYGDSTDEQTSGWSSVSDGSRADDRRRRDSQDRIKWAGVTASIVTIAIIMVQMFGILDSNNENSQTNLERTEKIPSLLEKAEELADALNGLQDQVEEIPTTTPTAPPTTVVVKGEPGEPGKPGQVVTSPPKTVVVEKPGPTQTVYPSPRPTCRTSLLGTCVAP
jgi:hypothetical protein